MCTEGNPCPDADDLDESETYHAQKVHRDDPNAAQLLRDSLASVQATFAEVDPDTLEAVLVATRLKDGTVNVTGGGDSQDISTMLIGIIRMYLRTNAALGDPDSIEDMPGSTPRTPESATV